MDLKTILRVKRPLRFIDTHTLKLISFSQYGDRLSQIRYAILSHQWKDGEEANFRDYSKLTSDTEDMDSEMKMSIWNQSGYQKIRNACAEACQSQIPFLWVDTCCINREDIRELSRDIQLMSAFYENSTVCYVYLMDIGNSSQDSSLHPAKAFYKSSWFRRGWTLQELLAPHTVKFFDTNWNQIGFRSSQTPNHDLSQAICQTTMIPTSILSSTSEFTCTLRRVSITDRISWALDRECTVPEDRAYSLMGILGAFIEPRYGEGVEMAFERLEAAYLEMHPENNWQAFGERGKSLYNVVMQKDHTIPPYAILSHRWIEGEEVTLQEYSSNPISDETQRKSGFQKILKACALAQKDNLTFLWVDTCCIDKENLEELSQDIQSMYAYYKNAKVCYAYLLDVGQSSEKYSHQAFFHSGWFKRGWTLQELLAPRALEFFDAKWNYFGSKENLSEPIFQATTIPDIILSGQFPISDVPMMERMCWAVARQTTKEEDLAYCLMGLLGAFIEPKYGEGIERAFQRLGKVHVQLHPESQDELGTEGEGLYRKICDDHKGVKKVRDSENYMIVGH
ncbi:HET-domain-containing protein [Dendrothele bispora CBS 962.96]|uniref:HET-domain-containing protein n=1 Tax=Dendrothele bispora (strain CBS 962.96) TaxID=1314807 RepID=A0A4S8M271_DENBC|nr:HET-domain-containing protein [Dendrothele bispora CBS 962.96]